MIAIATGVPTCLSEKQKLWWKELQLEKGKFKPNQVTLRILARAIVAEDVRRRSCLISEDLLSYRGEHLRFGSL